MIRLAFYVGLGGMAGSILRFLISQWMMRTSTGHMPLATLIVNVVGSFLLGVLFHYMTKMDRAYYLLLTSGFCGGFTTFSTFSVENINLLLSNGLASAALYICLSLFLGLLAAGFGWYLGRLYLV